MPLNLYNGGAAVPHIRYMAGTSSWSISTEQGMQAINLPRCCFDLANIQTGWGLFAENSPPEWIWDPSLSMTTPRPQDGREWKRGFRVNVILPQTFTKEQVREFATTATGAVEGIKKLYAAYEKDAPSNAGKIPVVEFQGAVNGQFGKGRTNVPTLVIVGWADRPAILNQSAGNGGAASAPAPAAPQPSPQPAANPVQPPQTPAVTDQGNLSMPVF